MVIIVKQAVSETTETITVQSTRISKKTPKGCFSPPQRPARVGFKSQQGRLKSHASIHPSSLRDRGIAAFEKFNKEN
jgi:hypothetical protein